MTLGFLGEQIVGERRSSMETDESNVTWTVLVAVEMQRHE